jgi:Flp pilus assembly protein TadG
MTVRRLGVGDGGSSDALGMALIAPAALALAIAVLLISRGVDSRATAQSAAEAAAQAAAQQRNRGDAQAAAQQVGAAMLTDPSTCASPSVRLGGTFAPGETISVTVGCSTSTAGLELVPSTPTGPQEYTAFAVIDPFRGVDP